MQPRRATRGIAAVAFSSATLGLLLLAIALLISACGGSSTAAPAPSTTVSTSVSTSGSTAAATTAAPSAPTTTAAAPPSGASPSTSLLPDGTVPSVPVTTAPAVPLTAAAPAVGGGSISIGTISSIQGTAQLPGEIAGPAVQVPVTLVNGSAGPINLDQVVVDLVDRAGVSAGGLTASPAAPFTGTLAPGATARATYVFSLATDDRRDVRITVSYTTAAPVVVFTGTIA